MLSIESKYSVNIENINFCHDFALFGGLGKKLFSSIDMQISFIGIISENYIMTVLVLREH